MIYNCNLKVNRSINFGSDVKIIRRLQPRYFHFKFCRKYKGGTTSQDPRRHDLISRYIFENFFENLVQWTLFASRKNYEFHIIYVRVSSSSRELQQFVLWGNPNSESQSPIDQFHLLITVTGNIFFLCNYQEPFVFYPFPLTLSYSKKPRENSTPYQFSKVSTYATVMVCLSGPWKASSSFISSYIPLTEMDIEQITYAIQLGTTM